MHYAPTTRSLWLQDKKSWEARSHLGDEESILRLIAEAVVLEKTSRT
jgi:hypothetical protein